jgi:hypothetical protein
LHSHSDVVEPPTHPLCGKRQVSLSLIDDRAVCTDACHVQPPVKVKRHKVSAVEVNATNTSSGVAKAR